MESRQWFTDWECRNCGEQTSVLNLTQTQMIVNHETDKISYYESGVCDACYDTPGRRL